MGTVTGYTAERMKTIEDTTVISGHVTGTELILVCRNGTTIDAGSVQGPAGPPGTGGGDTSAVLAAATPVGTIHPFAGTTLPSGYLWCDGTSYLRAGTYNALFLATSISSVPIYGAADGSHFNVPNLQAKFPMGKANSGLDSTLGTTGGVRDAIVPTHSHSHSHGGVTADASLSVHQIAGDGGYRIWVSAGGAQNNTVTSTIGTGSAVLSHVDDHAPHHHTISADATASGVSPTDGNLPPFVVINYIIKY